MMGASDAPRAIEAFFRQRAKPGARRQALGLLDRSGSDEVLQAGDEV